MTAAARWSLLLAAAAYSSVAQAAEHPPLPEHTRSKTVWASPPVTAEVGVLHLIEPAVGEIPISAQGMRLALGPRFRRGKAFTFAPILLIESYRGETQAGLDFSSLCITLGVDLTPGLDWVHLSAHFGRGEQRLKRVTTGGELVSEVAVIGINLSPEWRISPLFALHGLIGYRWLGDIQTQVIGAGFRM